MGLKSFFEGCKYSFTLLSTNFRKDGSFPVVHKADELGRYVCTEASVIDSVWLTSDIETYLEAILDDGEFPKNQLSFHL